MRTVGHGRAVKDAASGALQWRRGDAPNAALRLAPTLAADNGQRTRPHAKAPINARVRPHATPRRMLSQTPSELGEHHSGGTHTAARQARRQRPSPATSLSVGSFAVFAAG